MRSPRRPGKQRFMVAVLALAALDLGLEQFMIVPIVPAVQESYAAPLGTAAWLLTGFLLTSVATVPLLSRLGDLHGKRRILFVALGLLAAGSLLCALAGSIELLIAGRVVQGAGAAVAPLAIGLARDHARPERVPIWIGLLVAGAGVGIAAGLLLGGVLVDAFAVSAVFWFLFGFAILLITAVAYVVPESPHRDTGRVDWIGALLLSSALVAALVAITKGNEWGWASGRVIALLAVAAALVGAFAAVERSVAAPVLDVRLLGQRSVWSANLVAFSVGFVLIIAGVVIPQLGALPRSSGYGLGLTTTGIGLLLLPSGLAIIAGGWASGALVSRVGARVLAAAGMGFAAAAYAVLIVFHESIAWVALANALLGLGISVGFTAAMNLVVHAVASSRTSVFAATASVSRATGGALGGQIAAAVIIGAGLTAEGLPAQDGFTGSFVLGAVSAAVALVATVTMPRRVRDPSTALGQAEEARATS